MTFNLKTQKVHNKQSLICLINQNEHVLNEW